MKKLAAALVLLSCSIASAEPRVAALEPSSSETSVSAPMTPPVSRADRYMSVGTAVGADSAVDWLVGGVAVEGGYRLTDTLWVRGRFDENAKVGDGAINQGPTLFAPEHPYSEAMSGLEWRGCAVRAVCVAGGFDVGYRFGDSGNGLVTKPRLGLDVGTEHVRFRPMLEATTSFLGRNTEPGAQGLPAFGIGLTTSVAYQW